MGKFQDRTQAVANAQSALPLKTHKHGSGWLPVAGEANALQRKVQGERECQQPWQEEDQEEDDLMLAFPAHHILMCS